MAKSTKDPQHTAESIAGSIIDEIKQCPDLAACKSFTELHDHCDANTLGRSEELLEVMSLEEAIPILNAAQNEVNLWLLANSIECQPHWDSVDMDVESHSAAFKIKHGRQADWNKEESLCDELWFDEIYLKIRALVKERTGK